MTLPFSPPQHSTGVTLNPVVTTSPDLLVIGGGLIGLAIAREASRLGLRVTLCERGEPGSGASRAAAGMLSPLGEASHAGAYLEFGAASLRIYREWVGELEDRSGLDVEYRECGKIYLASTPDGERDLLLRREWSDSIGLRAEVLSHDETVRQLPGIAEEGKTGLLVQDDFRVSPRKLARALASAARRDGIDLRTGSAVRSLRVENGRIRGVILENGTFVTANLVVLSAGAWSGTIQGGPPLPLRPVRGQMAALHPDHPFPDRTVETGEIYLVPRDDGRILIGATQEEVGFREGNTAGGVQGLLAAATGLFPALASSMLGEMWSGLRPATSDGYPILGADPEIGGLYHASGHFRNGVLLAPATARVLAPILAGGGEDRIPREFSPARFGTAGA